MHIDPQAAFDVLKDNVVRTISGYFPYEGRLQKMELKRIWVDDKLSSDDLRSQADAKDQERTWGVPIKADLRLIDKRTGKAIDERTVTLARLPKMTSRYGFIVDGNEYQVDQLFRLKSGVYARVQENGDLKSEFNLASGNGFSIKMDPKRRFLLQQRTANIKLYPILRSLGVEDSEMEQSWGKELLEANKPRTPKEYISELAKFFHSTSFEDQKAPEDLQGLTDHVKNHFSKTVLRPDTTAITLGKPFTQVTGEAFRLATAKLLGVARGTQKPDDRDSLAFKEIVSIEDFIPQRIDRSERSIKGKLRGTIDHKKSVIEVVSPNLFAQPILDFFKKGSSITERSEQTNPLQMLAGHHKTTIIAPDFGGMKTEHTINDEMRVINPSHFGFIDPMHTPESSRTGITLHLNLAAQKRGNDLITPVYDLAKNKMVDLTATEFHNAHVVLPDQVTWIDGKPKLIADSVKVKVPGGDIQLQRGGQYVMPSTKTVFGVASNLIPFLPTDQGNRVSMADKQMEQAISLKHRQAPLVQSKADGEHTFERVLGHITAATAPISGKVVAITKDSIILQEGPKSAKTQVHLYDHFPLNDPKGMLHSTPVVQIGDTVKKGQLLADNNYTDKGFLALGTNLRVGYIPYKGYNFEDGIVISETASKKLTSEHLHRKSLSVDPDVDRVSKSQYLIHSSMRSNEMPEEHISALDDDGVIKPGSSVVPGQVLVASLHKNTSPRMAEWGRRSSQPWKDNALLWDEDHVGKVIKVVKSPTGKDIKVYVRTEEPVVVGDKLTGRHGNKGIVTMILPDHEMPFTMNSAKERRPLEVLLNPTGVPTRINGGQILETAAGKIAEKTGKPYVVDNFAGPNHDYRHEVEKDLAAHGLSDEEPVYDPDDVRKPLGSVMVGPQHILKLKHQVEKKLSVRGGGTDLSEHRLPVDVDRQPSSGGGNSGQGLGQLELYVLLGHNARHQLRETATYRSDLQDMSFWAMVQQGYEPPPPKVPFAYEKFLGLLKGMGINVEKVGTKLRLQPLTDKEIVNMAGGHRGEIKNAHLTLRAKDLKEEKHGLFDPAVTGGREGTKWGFIKLQEPMPNPVFVGAGNQTGPIPTLLNLRIDDIEKVMKGEMQLNGRTGGKAIEEALKKIDVDKEIVALRERFKTVKRGTDLDRTNKKLKYLLALKETGYSPNEAYVLHYVPVLPPVFRPVTEMSHTGDLHFSSLNGLYKNLAITNQKVAEFDPNVFTETHLNPLRYDLYDRLKALQAIGGAVGYDTDSPGGRRQLKGILSIIGGGVKRRGEKEQPKDGYFQKRLVKRRQNLSIRSTIIPEPKLGIDEVGIPRNAAMELYKPFVVAELGKMGLPPLEAQEHMKKGADFAWKALERVVADRPMLLKRDPTLHKFSIMAFKPKLIEGKAIQIHPLVTGPYNADFDGDTMSGFVPISREAVEEAKRMLPSKNLFSPTTGGAVFVPSQEAMLGLHLLTKWGKKVSKTFDTVADLKKAYAAQQIEPSDVVQLKGAKGETTLGRLLIAERLPSGFRHNTELLHDPEFIIKKKTMNLLSTTLAKEHPREFAESIDELKNLGNEHSFKAGFSFGLKDLKPLPERTKILADAHREVEHIRKSSGSASKDEVDAKVIDVYQKATEKLEEAARTHYAKNDNRLAQMVFSGARGKEEQLRQMIAAPMLLQDGTGKILTTPITRSYSEGLDIGDYWLAQHGARKGTMQRALETSEPGSISKDILNATMSTLIVSPDCKTTAGVLMRLAPPKDSTDSDHTHKDVHDRFLATGYKLTDGSSAKAGSLLTPELIGRLKNSGHEKVLVRSPLKCQHGDGICAKCFGLNENGKPHEVGTNIGVLAGQALSEPAVQMAMDAFHTGGLASGRGAESVDRLTRLSQLLEMPKELKGSAVLAGLSGKISDIKKDIAGGFDVFVNGESHRVKYPKKLLPHVQLGAEVERGKPLTGGPLNPLHLLRHTDINRVQKYLTDEMFNSLYEKEGVRRRNIEVVVRSLTNLTKVKDPGQSEYLPGDVVPRSVIDEHNRSLIKGQKPVLHEPVLHGIKQVSSGAGSTDWMGLLNYQRLARTLTRGAAQAWKSDIHGTHPIPAFVHGAEFGKPPKDKPKHVY